MYKILSNNGAPLDKKALFTSQPNTTFYASKCTLPLTVGVQKLTVLHHRFAILARPNNQFVISVFKEKSQSWSKYFRLSNTQDFRFSFVKEKHTISFRITRNHEARPRILIQTQPLQKKPSRIPPQQTSFRGTFFTIKKITDSPKDAYSLLRSSKKPCSPGDLIMVNCSSFVKGHVGICHKENWEFTSRTSGAKGHSKGIGKHQIDCDGKNEVTVFHLEDTTLRNQIHRIASWYANQALEFNYSNIFKGVIKVQSQLENAIFERFRNALAFMIFDKVNTEFVQPLRAIHQQFTEMEGVQASNNRGQICVLLARLLTLQKTFKPYLSHLEIPSITWQSDIPKEACSNLRDALKAKIENLETNLSKTLRSETYNGTSFSGFCSGFVMCVILESILSINMTTYASTLRNRGVDILTLFQSKLSGKDLKTILDPEIKTKINQSAQKLVTLQALKIVKSPERNLFKKDPNLMLPLDLVSILEKFSNPRN